MRSLTPAGRQRQAQGVIKRCLLAEAAGWAEAKSSPLPPASHAPGSGLVTQYVPAGTLALGQSVPPTLLSATSMSVSHVCSVNSAVGSSGGWAAGAWHWLGARLHKPTSGLPAVLPRLPASGHRRCPPGQTVGSPLIRHTPWRSRQRKSTMPGVPNATFVGSGVPHSTTKPCAGRRTFGSPQYKRSQPPLPYWKQLSTAQVEQQAVVG